MSPVDTDHVKLDAGYKYPGMIFPGVDHIYRGLLPGSSTEMTGMATKCQCFGRHLIRSASPTSRNEHLVVIWRP